jgi:hypothetical protein
MQKFLQKAIPTIASLFLLSLGFFSSVPTVSAEDYGLGATAGAANLMQGRESVPVLTGNIIGTALSMISVIFFVLMVYGGFMWMTAHGDESQITKARETIIAAVIGIVIILASYAITKFVMGAVDQNAVR